MSGIFGQVRFDGGPVDRRILDHVAASLHDCAPDGNSICLRREIGLGHSWLRTRDATPDDVQPCTLDGKTWIVADARIDARSRLLDELGMGDRLPDGFTDAQLILHAYGAWSERCVERFLGDFSFAIWDEPRRRLFCARDHFGVKPFFYSLAGSRFSFANGLDAVRRFAPGDDELDDLAIADFLMFEMRQDPAATAFAAVRRLPPAHCLEVSAAGLRTRRYWDLPDPVEIKSRSTHDTVEGFRHVLSLATSDRVTTRRTSAFMSGGLDSTAVVSAALGLPGSTTMHAFAAVHDRLIPDRERHFAGIAARALRIPIEFCEADRYGLYERFEDLRRYFPEPANEPHAALAVDTTRMAASHSAVVLTGWDGDALLSESPRPYLRRLVEQRRWPHALRVAGRYALAERRLLPASMTKRLLAGAAPRTRSQPLPGWLSPDLVRTLRLDERWREIHATPRMHHPLRPYAMHVLGYIARRSDFFDGYTGACTGAPAEFRHPLLDLRVVEYCLSLPPFPWCRRKELMRRSLAGVLPEEIRLRPKTPLAGHPYMELLSRDDAAWIDRFVACPATERYVYRSGLPSARAESDPDIAWALLRPLSLDCWLRARDRNDTHRKELRHEYA